jgi:heat shock protein HslJ
MVTQGPNDPMCCPTQEVVNTYALQGDQLVATSSTVVSKTAVTSTPAGPTPKATAAAAATPQPTITGILWKLQQIQMMDGTTTAISTPDSYTLELTAPDQTAVKADCNVGSGIYKITDPQITITIQTMTMAFCPPPSVSDRYITALNAANSYVVRDGNLFISFGFDSGILKFAPGVSKPSGTAAAAATPQPTITGIVWKLQQIQMMDGTTTAISTPDSYTLELTPPDQAAVKADCNVGGGTYKITDPQISITIQRMTMAFCPPPSVSDRYVAALNAANSYVVRDGYLFISFGFDSGILKFAPGK